MSERCPLPIDDCSECDRVELACHPAHIHAVIKESNNAAKIIDVKETPEYQELRRNFLDFVNYVHQHITVGNEGIYLRAIEELKRLGVKID